MSKFVIECPECGRYVEASNSFFARKKIDCTCGYTINVRTDKMASKICPHCGNQVIYDQSKGSKALCPVCKEPVNTTESLINVVEFTCPSCSCKLTADKSASQYTCPLCDTVIDVARQVAKQKEKNKGLASVIKYEGDNQTLVWKHPIEDFNLGSQLIVHESQEAVFFRDGRALDLFPAGRYTLATQNLPLLEELYKLPVNADTVFHSEVYFVNQTVQMGIKWGTDSKVRLFDPATGIYIEIGASGQFSLRVTDSRKILIKLVGTAGTFTHDDVIDSGGSVQPVVAKFKALIMTKVKSNLAGIIKENQINILEIDQNLDLISDKLKDSINEVLNEYGLVMPEFFVTAIMTPDDDPNYKRLKQQHADLYLKVRQEQILKAEAEASAERKMVEAQTEARMKVISAQGEAEAYRLKAAAEAEEMRMKGYTYQQETARQIGMGAVENMGNIGSGSGGGSILGGIGDLAGLGISLGAMGGIMNMTRDAVNPLLNSTAAVGSELTDTISGAVRSGTASASAPAPVPVQTWSCPQCHTENTGKFCSNCAAPRPAPAPEPVQTWSCPQCHTENMGKFCSNCATPRPAPAPEPVQTWSCPQCHTENTGNFCSNCGKKKGELNDGEIQ